MSDSATPLTPPAGRRLDVGDTWTVEISTETADGQATAATVADLSATLYPPRAAGSDVSGQLVQDDDVVTLAIELTTHGDWVLEVESASLKQTERYLLRVPRPPR